jgi:hypothetical protein
MTSHQFFDFFGFIVNTKAINDSTGCFVHPWISTSVPSRNLITTLSSALTDVISQKWACVTSMTTFYSFAKIKIRHKAVGGGKEHLPGDLIEPGLFLSSEETARKRATLVAKFREAISTPVSTRMPDYEWPPPPPPPASPRWLKVDGF